MNKTLYPPTKFRVSVPVHDSVHDVFKRLAKASGMSTGRAMGEWLADTVEAAEYMAQSVERARAAPRIVTQELHAYALGLADETGQLMRQIAEKGRADRAAARDGTAPAAARTTTPPSNTGVTKKKKANKSPNRAG
jgi:hypothetical protein